MSTNEEDRGITGGTGEKALSATQRQIDRSAIAQTISQDLLIYLGKCLRPADMELIVFKNQLKLLRKLSGRSLKIFCFNEDFFEITADSKIEGVFDRNGMARRTMTWVQS